VVQPGRDASGAAIALFTARLHHPSQTSHQAVLNALIFQLDVAMERFACTHNNNNNNDRLTAFDPGQPG